MQNVAVDAILLALEKLRPHGGHGAPQHRVSRSLQAPAMNQRKEGVEALPVYVEVVRDGAQCRRRRDQGREEGSV